VKTGFLEDLITEGVRGGRLEQRQAALREVLAEGHDYCFVLATYLLSTRRATGNYFLEEWNH
jgi:hypothetical protein